MIATRIQRLKVDHFPRGIPGGDGHTWLATDIGDAGQFKPVGVGHTENEAVADLEEFLMDEFLEDAGLARRSGFAGEQAS